MSPGGEPEADAGSDATTSLYFQLASHALAGFHRDPSLWSGPGQGVPAPCDRDCPGRGTCHRIPASRFLGGAASVHPVLANRAGGQEEQGGRDHVEAEARVDGIAKRFVAEAGPQEVRDRAKEIVADSNPE